MRMAVLCVSLALGFAAGYTARQAERVGAREVRLFVIERSTNANVVAYDARLGDGGFDVRDPISVYWILHEEGGEREELSALERRMAFGVRVSRATAEEVVFSLAALPDRPITVRLEREGPVATVEIGEEIVRLEAIFVAAKERSLVPGVEYVELGGTRLRDGEKTKERIRP